MWWCRRGLHGHVDGLAPAAGGARRARGRPRGRRVRPRPERTQRRFLRVDVAERARRCGERFGDGPARALLDASSRSVGDDRRLVPRAGGGRLVRSVRLPVRVHGSRRSTRSAAPPSRPRPRWARPSASWRWTRPRCGRAATRPLFRGGVIDPRLRHRAAGAAGAGPAQAADRARRARLRELARGAPALRARRGRGARRDRGPAASGPAPPCSRSGPAARALRAAAHPAVGHLVPHRAHRAGARRARGDRLDRRRVHHRRPHARPLLPHHARRTHRLRLGRRAGSPTARA